MFGLLAVVIVVAFAARVAYVALQSASPIVVGNFVSGDAIYYLELGRNIAAGNGMSIDGSPTAFVGPGYPVFLGLLLKLGLDPLGVGIVQAGLGATTAGLIAVLAAEFATPQSKRTWAAVAGGSAAAYPHLVFWTGYVLTETVFVFLVVACLVSTLMAIRRESLPAALIAGAIGAAAALTRPAFLGVIVSGGVWWLIREGAAGRGARLLLPVVFGVAAAIPIAAWTVRNFVDLGAPIVTSTEGGNVFYQGNSRNSTGGSTGYVDQRDYTPIIFPPGMSEVEKDAEYLRAAVRDVRADPIGTIARWPAKLWNMWRPTYEGASVRNGLVTVGTYVPVLVLGGLGAGLLARKGFRQSAVLPALFLLLWAVEHMVVTAMIRFRLPAEAVLLATLPAGLEGFRTMWSRRPK